MTYKKLRERQQKEVNDFPFMFAFSEGQFNKGMQEKFGLSPEDTDKICSIGAGGFVKKEDSGRMHEMFSRHRKELEEAISADTTGTGFIKDMFYSEMCNHEYSYTGDISETLQALGLTAEEVNANPALMAGLKAATVDVMANCE